MIIVDLQHPRRSASRSYRKAFGTLSQARPGAGSHTTPIPLAGQDKWRCRYAYGYGLDGSEIPIYLVLPERSSIGSFVLLECVANDSIDLRGAPSIEPIGVAHFYDEGFGLQLEKQRKPTRDLRETASISFCLDSKAISADLTVAEDEEAFKLV